MVDAFALYRLKYCTTYWQVVTRLKPEQHKKLCHPLKLKELPDSLNTSLEPLAIRSALRAALNDATCRDDVAENKQT